MFTAASLCSLALVLRDIDPLQMPPPSQTPTLEQPVILARGPWALDRVRTCWLAEKFEPSPAHTKAADAAIRGLRDRGSPSHDGMAARLVDYRLQDDGIASGAEDAVSPDHEHDAHAWWPREIARWPAEAGEPLRRMASLLEE